MLYNIQKFSLIFLSFLLFLTNYLQSQVTVSKYGTTVLASKKAYNASVKANPLRELKPLHQSIPGLIIDLRYATKQNFMDRKMYPASTHETYLRAPAASALSKVQDELQKEGLGLKIFDAYRPYSVTVKFWELIHDERYVAHPAKGSGHNRGLSVDLTIIELKTGKELNMGTGFDHFSDTAYHSFKQLPANILQNREKLKNFMMAQGFVPLETEWWHYAWPNNENYEVLDLPFSTLKK